MIEQIGQVRIEVITEPTSALHLFIIAIDDIHRSALSFYIPFNSPCHIQTCPQVIPSGSCEAGSEPVATIMRNK